jgi:hypothetical protein
MSKYFRDEKSRRVPKTNRMFDGSTRSMLPRVLPSRLPILRSLDRLARSGLKGTKHLQGRTKTHWATWIGSVVGCGVFAFVICGAVPFFGSLIGLIGAIAYAPMAVSCFSTQKRQILMSDCCANAPLAT